MDFQAPFFKPHCIRDSAFGIQYSAFGPKIRARTSVFQAASSVSVARPIALHGFIRREAGRSLKRRHWTTDLPEKLRFQNMRFTDRRDDPVGPHQPALARPGAQCAGNDSTWIGEPALTEPQPGP